MYGLILGIIGHIIIISVFLFNFNSLKTLPHTLLLHGKLGTADFRVDDQNIPRKFSPRLNNKPLFGK